MFKCRFSLVRYCHQPNRNEFFNFGVIIQCGDDNYVASKFSEIRMQRAGKLSPGADESLMRMVRRSIERAVKPIQSLHEDEKKQPLLGESFSIDPAKARMLDEGYLKYLSVYFNGLIQFTSPQAVATQDYEIELERLYNTFVADPEEFVGVTEKRPPNKVYARLRRELQTVSNQLDLDYELTRHSAEGIMKGMTLDFIGANGVIVCGKSIDPESQGVDNAATTLVTLFQIFDSLRNNYEDRGMEESGKYYVIAMRPKSERGKFFDLWKDLVYWSPKKRFTLLEVDGAYQINQYVRQKGVMRFSEWLRRRGGN